jgi:hypothetical protein
MTRGLKHRRVTKRFRSERPGASSSHAAVLPATAAPLPCPTPRDGAPRPEFAPAATRRLTLDHPTDSRDIVAMSSPIKLTDCQIEVIMTAAAPLAPADRSPFLEAVAAGLRDREIGDGLVHRVIAEAQRKFFAPPVPERAVGTSKWR